MAILSRLQYHVGQRSPTQPSGKASKEVNKIAERDGSGFRDKQA